MEFINKNRKIIIFVIFVFIVATASFALGYIYGRDMSRTPIIIERAV